MNTLRRVVLLSLFFAVCALGQAAHSVTLNWNWTQGTGGAATGFQVQRSTTMGGPYTTIGTVSSPATLTYVDASGTGNVLVEGTKYFYVVETTGNGGTVSAPSNEASGTIPFSVPTAPGSLTLTIKLATEALPMSRPAAVSLVLLAALVAAISQIPNPPSGLAGATGSITVMIDGRTIGSASVLNFQSLNGNNWSCSADAALNAIDCNLAIDTAAVLSKQSDQAFGDHVVFGTSTNGVSFNGSPTVNQISGGLAAGSLWVLFPNMTNGAGATLDLGGLGPHPLQVVSGGALVNVAGGECPANIPCLLITVIGTSQTVFRVIH